MGHHSVRLIEGFGRIVRQNENIELAQTKVMTVNCREVVQFFDQAALKSN
jgi:hypothetical protein